MKGKVAVAMVLLMVVSQSASAVSILYYKDLDLGTNMADAALAGMGLTGSTFFTVSPTTMDTQLGAGPWDLVIVAEQQNGGGVPVFATALDSYIAGGGSVLATTWLDGTLRGLLDAASCPSYNDAAITPDGHAIFEGISSDILLTNPGWGVYSRSWLPAAGAQGLGTLGSGYAVILGNGGQTLLQGPLFDSFFDSTQGERFVANEINFLLNGQAPVIPEPLTMVGLLMGMAGVARYVRKRKTA